MPADILDLSWPTLGVHRRLGYQSGPGPYAAFDAQNCRTADVFEARLRGGSRPGLAKAFPDLLGSGNPIRLLNSIRTGQELPVSSTFEDSFSGSTLQSVWSLWTQTDTPSDTPSLPTVENGQAILDASASNDEHVGAIRDAISYNASANIEIESKLWTSNGITNLTGRGSIEGQRWHLAMGLSSASDFDGGVVVSWQAQDSGNFNVAIYNQGSLLLNSPGFVVTGNVVRIVFIPGGTLQLYMGSANNLVATVTGVTLSGTRVAFGAWHSSGASVDAGFEYFNFSYTPTASATPIAEPALVASSNHVLYYEDSSGSIAEVTSQNMDLASDRLLSSAERFGKLYIADYEVRASGTNGVLSGSGVTFNSVTYDPPAATQWDDLSIDFDGDLIELFSGGSGTYTPGRYAISSTNAGAALTIADAGTNGSSIPFRVIRSTKVFDYRLSGSAKLSRLTKNSHVDSTVDPPIGCTIAAIWMDRLVLSGDPENPGDVFMSKQGDPTWWTEDADAATSAVFGEFDTNTRMNEPVTALIPYVKDYLIIGGISSISVLRGNPILGGTVDFVTREVGILDKFAWCTTPENVLLVMTGDGIYAIGPDAASAEPVSRDRLPREFIGIDTVNNDVQMAFDVRRNGAIVAVTPKTVGAGQFFFFDWQTKGFWPDAYASAHQPTAMAVYTQSTESTPTMIFGGRDGYTREFVDSAQTDDGTNFDSFVLIGPIALGGGGYFDGMVREIVGQLATVSGSARVAVQVGNSIEAAYRAEPRNYYTMRAGKGLSNFPRLRGNCCFLRVEGIPGTAWALEILTMVRERFGKQRLLA